MTESTKHFWCVEHDGGCTTYYRKTPIGQIRKRIDQFEACIRHDIDRRSVEAFIRVIKDITDEENAKA